MTILKKITKLQYLTLKPSLEDHCDSCNSEDTLD